jgi:adenine-specific DNA-methyltransferase
MAATQEVDPVSMTIANKLEPTALEKLQELLRTLFQFDLSDLDFGIYRLFRIRQDELKAFIDRQLPETVDRAFAGVAGSDSRTLGAEVAQLAERVRREIAPDALLDNGAIKAEFREIKASRIKELLLDYETKKAKLDAVRVTEEQKLDVFNHLFNFFSRYYDAGDFIPKRFYGGRDRYAVPYNGAETYFHWANKDQHYVKTAEAFRDYAFTIEALGGPFRVRFVVTSANVPKDNTKGDRRYFFPLPAEATYDPETKTFRLPFHYRLPTAAEVKGGNGPATADEDDEGPPKRLNGDKLQDAVLQAALPEILAAVPEPALGSGLGELTNREAVDKDGAEPVSLLVKRCRHFTRRNTADYFIHKNLQKFLTEELEFYVKDQILHLGDLEGDFEGKRRMLRAFREVAADLIGFLAQIEDVQLRLFEKRKFVLRTDYLVTLANVARPLRREILDPQRSAKQLEEWKRLYAFDECAELLGWKGKLTEAFLERHPTLVINTANFDAEFRDRLLESFEDLGSLTDGLLIRSENLQAIRFVQRTLAGSVSLVYFDAPYNTGVDEFTYKDRYRHSSWLSFAETRLVLATTLLSPSGIVAWSLDDNEFAHLNCIVQSGMYGIAPLGEFVWRTRNTDNRIITNLSVDHEYIYIYAREGSSLQGRAIDRSSFDNPDNDPRGPYTTDPLTGKANKAARPNLHYLIVNPVTGDQYAPDPDFGWITDSEGFQNLLADNRIAWPKNPATGKPRKKRFLWEAAERAPVSSLAISINQGEGNQDLACVLGTKLLNFPKPVSVLQRLVDWTTDANGMVVDPFAGSGTTGAAVIGLNREDGGRRKFVLVEMAGHFDTTILPRLERIIWTPAWKDGRAERLASDDEASRASRLVKVLRLESYEDALHNLTASDTQGRSDVRAAAYAATVGAEAYRLHYLARLPLAESASMLQMDKLEHPFNYTLEILTDDGPQTQTVDLVETFNYLLGLDVQRLERWENAKDKVQGRPRRYRIVKGRERRGKRVLVVWRDMTGLDPKVEREFLEARLKREEAFDRLLINGDSATPGFESLDGLFKQLMTD